ncbi:MAG: hypothetical protein RIS64_3142 [Bacteroidota bacterium]
MVLLLQLRAFFYEGSPRIIRLNERTILEYFPADLVDFFRRFSQNEGSKNPNLRESAEKISEICGKIF